MGFQDDTEVNMDCLNPDNRTEMQKAKDVAENPWNGVPYFEEALTETLSMYSDSDKANLVKEIYKSRGGGKGHELKKFLDDVANYMKNAVFNES